MSFNRIYGYGETPHKAFITSKMNEIGCNIATPFLKKTRIYSIRKPDDLEGDLLELYIIVSCGVKSLEGVRGLTTTEANYYNNLVELYGIKELEKICRIYRGLDDYKDMSLCIRMDTLYEGYNVYKFLF